MTVGSPAPGQSTAGQKPRAWWRRNAVSLIALAVLVPTTIVVIGFQEWRVYYVGRHWQHVPVEPGGTIEVAGATIGPATIAAVPASAGIEVPQGARALAVLVTLAPGDEPLSCMPPQLVDVSTGDSWGPTYAPLGWEGEQSCFELTAPTALHIPYLVPADAGPFAIDVEVLHPGGELPRLLLDGP